MLNRQYFCKAAPREAPGRREQCQRTQLITAVAGKDWMQQLESNNKAGLLPHLVAGAGKLAQQLVDLLLGPRVEAGLLAHVHHARPAVRQSQDVVRNQPAAEADE